MVNLHDLERAFLQVMVVVWFERFGEVIAIVVRWLFRDHSYLVENVCARGLDLMLLMFRMVQVIAVV